MRERARRWVSPTGVGGRHVYTRTTTGRGPHDKARLCTASARESARKMAVRDGEWIDPGAARRPCWTTPQSGFGSASGCDPAVACLHGADDGNRTRVFSLGIRSLATAPMNTCVCAPAVVTVGDRGRSGRIARPSHGPCSSPASSYWPQGMDDDRPRSCLVLP